MDRPRDHFAPGLCPTSTRFQLKLYLKRREGEGGNRKGKQNSGIKLYLPESVRALDSRLFLISRRGGIFCFFLRQRLPRAGHTSRKGLMFRTPLSSATEQLAPAPPRFPLAKRQCCSEVL